MRQLDKETVDYGRGMPQSHRGICAHFLKPDRCEVVVGKISARGWCTLFKRATK